MMPNMHRATHPDDNSEELLSFFPDISPFASLNAVHNTPGTTTDSICLPPVLPVQSLLLVKLHHFCHMMRQVAFHYPCLKVPHHK